MPTFSYKGYDFDVDHTPSAEEFTQMSAYVDSLPPKEQAKPKETSTGEALLEGAKGTAALVGDLIAGIPKLGAQAALAVGGKIAEPDRSLQQTWETAGQAMEATFPSFRPEAGTLAAQPYEVGMKPFELYEKGIGAVAEKAGEFAGPDVQGAINIMGSFAPIPFAGKAGRAAGKVIEAVDPGLRKITPEAVKAAKDRPTPAQAAAAAMEREAAAKTAQQREMGGQMEMFPETPLEGQATPYEAGQMGVTEPVAPKLQRRQMELPFGEERGPLIADTQGQIFRGDVTTPEARLGLQEAERATAQELKKGTILEHPPGEPLPYLQAPELPFNVRTRGQGGAINPEVFKEGFEKVKELANGIRLKAQALYDGELVIVALDPQGNELGRAAFEPTAAGAKGQDAKSFITKVVPEAQRQGLATEFYKFTSELGNDISPDTVQTEAGRAMWKGFEKTGLAQQGRIRKQGGGVLFDFGKKPKVDKIAKGPLKKAFPEFTRVAETPEEVAALAAASPDVERGIVGKTLGQFTKGMLFEKLKTDNPVLKYTYDTISEAVDAATFTVKNLIQKTLNPTLMALSKQEKGEVGDLLVAAMKNKKDLTPEFMREHGFNEKQIKAAMTLKEVHTENFKNLNESRRLAGKPPMEPYVGYVAGLATGNFRRLVVERGPDGTPRLDANGEPIPVGYVGSDFRRTMNKRVDALLENNPDWMALPEKYTGVAKRKQESTQALVDALTILSDGNPNFDRFGKAMDELITGDTYRALGAKKHTMGKKGIMGMEGDKPWQDSYENAMDLFNAQIRYTETMAKWAEFSKAMDKLSVVFSDPAVQKQQSYALELADDYIKNAMGQNPSKVGQAVDGWIGAVGEQMGVGPAVLRHTISAARNTVNTLFFALNHGWMILNTIQPALSMPTTKAFMRGRGIDLNWDVLGTSDLLAKGGYSSMKHLAGWKETPFEQAMWKYAKEHGIDQTNLVDSHHHLQQGPSYWLNQSLKMGANAVEAGPRSVMFATIAHILDAAGHGKDPDIFPVARQLTDMAMVDLRKHEQIKATKHLGMFGEMSANLTSFPQNQLSAWATYAREMGKGNYGAFTTALVSAVAYAGVMGLPGFTQADYITEMLSRMMGKPTSLTKLTLDMANDVNSKYHNKVGDVLAMGVGAHYGVDLHTRLGNPSMIPTLTGGGGKLLDIGEAAWEVAKDPSEWNKRLLMKEVALPPFKPWIDQNWFTRTTSLGEQIALNKEGKGTVMRTEKDILFKKLGFTGSAESKGKALDYAASQQDKYYDDMRKKIPTQVQKASAANNGAIPEAQLVALIKDYVDAEGDPDSFLGILEKSGVNFNTTTRARRILSSQGASVSAAKRLERTPR